MKKVLLASALLLSVAATPVLAGPNWNQVSIGYLSTDLGDEDLTGFGIAGTKLLNSNFFLAGSYTMYSENVDYGVDLDFNFLSLGIGARKAVASNTDIFGVVSFENAETALTSGYYEFASVDDSGYGLTAGVRSMVTPKFELSGAVSYIEIDDVDGTSFNVGADYHFTNQFAAGIDFGTSDDVDTFTLSGTFKF